MKQLTTLTQRQAEDVIQWCFGGDEVEIRCHRVKILTTRAIHQCMCPGNSLHLMRAGTEALRETAVIDGVWSTCYVCMACAIWQGNAINLFGTFGSHPDLICSDCPICKGAAKP